MVFQPGAHDLLAVVQVFGPDEAHHRIDQQWLEFTGHRVRARLARLLVHAVVGIGGQGAALPRFKIHDVVADSTAPQRQRGRLRFGQQRQVDAEAGVGGLGAGNRLEHQVHRRAALDGGQRVGDVGEHARLGGDFVAGNDLVQHGHQPDHLRHVVGGGVDADHGIAAAVQQAVEHAGGNAGGVVGRVVRLQPGGHAAGQADGVAKARDHEAFARDQHQVLDAHDFRDGCRHLGRDAGRHCRQRGLVGRIAQQPVAQVAHRQVRDGGERRAVVVVDDQARDFVRFVRDHQLVEEHGQWQIGQRHLRGHAFFRAACCELGQLPIAAVSRVVYVRWYRTWSTHVVAGVSGAAAGRGQEERIAHHQETGKHAEDQRVVINHGHQADYGACQGDGGKHGIARRTERPHHVRLAAPQLEQAEHADDVHGDRPEHGHGDDAGGERHAAHLDQLVAEDGGNAHHAAGNNRPVRRVEARMHLGQERRQVGLARQRIDLPRVAEDDAVERRDQPEQPEEDQHVQPAAVLSDHGFHGLRQRVVDVGQPGPVAGAARKHHHAHRQQHQRDDAADVGNGNRALRVFRFLGSHGHALDGQEKPDGKRDRCKNAGHGSQAEVVLPGPAAFGEVGDGKTGRHHAHEYQQLENCQQRHQQLERGGHLHAHDIERHEHDVGGHGRQLGVDLGKLHVEIGADGQRNGGRRKHELDQGGGAGQVAAGGAKGAAAVGERPARIGNRGGQLGKAEDKGGVHQRDEQRGDRKTQGAGRGPAVTPAEIFAGDHQPHGDAPQLESSQRLPDVPVSAVAGALAPAGAGMDQAHVPHQRGACSAPDEARRRTGATRLLAVELLHVARPHHRFRQRAFAARGKRGRRQRFHGDGDLAHLGHFPGRGFAAAVAPAGLDEVDDIGHLLVVELLGIRRHGQRRRRRVGRRHGATGQDDVDGRRGIPGLQHGVTGQRRECLVVTEAVRAVAAGALVHGHAGQVGVAQVLGGMRNHVVHGAKRCRVAVAALLEEVDDVGRAPARQSAAVFVTQRRHVPAIDYLPAGQEVGIALAIAGGRQRFFLHRHAARRVAGAAVAQAFDQVGAAQDLRVGHIGCRRLERFRLRCKCPAPDRQREAHRQRPHDVRLAARRRVRLDAVHEVRVQRLHVGLAQARVRRIRHGRIHGVTGLGDAGAHQLVEVGKAPVADPRLFIGRDVGRIDLADRRRHAEAAGKRLAVGNAMAGKAVAGAGQVLLADGLGRPVSQRSSQAGRVVTDAGGKHAGAHGKHVVHVPALQVTVQYAGPGIGAHGGAAGPVRGLVVAQVEVVAEVFHRHVDRFRIHGLGHGQHLVRHVTAHLDVVVLPVEGKAQQLLAELVGVGGVEVDIAVAVHHVGAVDVERHGIGVVVLDRLFPVGTPRGRAVRHRDAGNRLDAGRVAPGGRTAHKTQWAVVEVVAVVVVHCHAVAAGTDERVGVLVRIEKHLHGGHGLIGDIAPYHALAADRIVWLAHARHQEQVGIVVGKRTGDHQVGRLLDGLAVGIDVRDAGGLLLAAVEVNAQHITVRAQFKIGHLAQRRHDVHLRRRLGIVVARKTGTEAAEVTRPHLAAIRIGVRTRGIGRRRHERVQAHVGSRLVEQVRRVRHLLRRQRVMVGAAGLEKIAFADDLAIDAVRHARCAEHFFNKIEMRFQLFVRDAEILDGHAFGNKFLAVARFIVRAQFQLFRQHAPVLARPVQAGATDARARLECADLAVWHGHAAHRVAERERALGQVLEQFRTLDVRELVEGFRIRAVRVRVLECAALERQHFHARFRQFLGHDGAGPAEADNDDLDLFHCDICHLDSLSDRGRRQRVMLAVLLDPVHIVGARAGEVDHFPGRHALVTAVDGIAEITLARVLQQLAEERLGRHVADGQRALFQFADDGVLLQRVECGKHLAQPGLGGGIEPRQPAAVQLARRHVELVAELGSGRHERRLHEPQLAVGIWGIHLQVDELVHAGFQRAGAVAAGRNQTLDQRLQGRPFRFIEKLGTVGIGRGGAGGHADTGASDQRHGRRGGDGFPQEVAAVGLSDISAAAAAAASNPDFAAGTLGERVAGALLNKIRTDGLTVGTRLPSETAMAQHFMVSRNIVRAAIALLREAGVLDTRKGSGAFISRLPVEDTDALTAQSIESLLNLIEVRRGLEGETAALAAQRRTPGQLLEIERALQRIEAAVARGEDGVEEDFRFHLSIAHATGNSAWPKLVEMFAAPIRAAVQVTRANEAQRAELAAQVLHEHRQIVAAIAASQPDQARAAAIEHMTQAARRVREADRAFWQGDGGALARSAAGVFALHTEPHGHGRRHEHRRIHAEQNADGQRHGKVVQRRAAEDQHRQHHHLGTAVGDDGARDGGRDRVVDHFMHGRLALLAEVFADTVENHDRFVDRVTEHRQHCRQHRQREFPLEEGKEAENDHHIVQVGDNRRHRVFPLEADGEVNHHADHHHHQRIQAVLGQLVAHLRTDEFHLLQRYRFGAGRVHARLLDHVFALGVDLVDLGHAALFGLAQRVVHQLRSILGGHVLDHRQAQHHVMGSAEAGRFRMLVADAAQRFAYRFEIGRLRVLQLHHGAAGEFHRQVQAAVEQEEHGRHEGQRRDDVENQGMPHERYVFFNAEKFHLISLELFRVRAPDGADGNRLQLLLAAVPEVDHATHDEHGGEHRGQNTQRVHHGETTDRTRTEHPQRHTDDQRGDVGVDDGGPGAVETGGDGRLRRGAGAQLFTDAFVDQHVGVDRHTKRQRNRGHARQGQRHLHQRQDRDQQQQVARQRNHAEHAEHHVVDDHEDGNGGKAVHRRVQAFFHVLGAQLRADRAFLDHFHRGGQRARAQQQRQLGRVLGVAHAGDLEAAAQLTLDCGHRQHFRLAFFEQHDGHFLAHAAGGGVAHATAAVTVQVDTDGWLVVLVHAGGSAGDVVAGQHHVLGQHDGHVFTDREQFRVQRHGRAQLGAGGDRFVDHADFQGGRAADHGAGTGHVLHAWQLHHDAVRTLLLDDRFRHTQLVDALGQRGNILLDAFVQGLLEGRRFQADYGFQFGVAARIGKRHVRHLVGQHGLGFLAGGVVAEVDLDGVAHALDAGVAHVLVAQLAAGGSLHALHALGQHGLGIDLHQEVHTAAQVETEVHRHGVELLHPFRGVGLQVQRHQVRRIFRIGVQVFFQHGLGAELGVRIGKARAHRGVSAGAIEGQFAVRDLFAREHFIDLGHHVGGELERRFSARHLHCRRLAEDHGHGTFLHGHFHAVRNLDGEVQIGDFRNATQHATGGDDFVALGQRFHHGLLFLGALHLRADHQEVHRHEHQYQETILTQEAAGAAECFEWVGLGGPCVEAVFVERFAHLAHDVEVVVQVVDGVEARTEDFLGAVQVVQIRAREIAAGVARAGGVQRLLVLLVARVLDLDVAKARKQPAVAGVPGRHHAVEHVHAVRHAGHQVFRRAHAHQVVRLVGRQFRAHVLQHAHHVFLRLAHRQAADGQAGEVDFFQARQRFVAQVFKHAALDDAEQRVRIFATVEFIVRALGPAQRHAHRLGRFVQRGRADRLVPAHEVVQAAKLGHHVVAGAQPQVEGVTQNNLGVDFLQFQRRHGFYGTQHGIAIAEEAVFVGDRMRVRGADLVVAGKGRHQHQQRRLGQVEIGDQARHRFKLVAGRDEQGRIGAARFQLAALRGRLQRAQAGGAHGHHVAAGRAGGAHRVHRLLRHGVPLGVHLVLGQHLVAHRLERAGAHVQRDEREVHALGLERIEQRLVEVQAGSRCGHRAGHLVEHGLVAGFVERIGIVLDVRRQRQAAVRFDQVEHVGVEMQGKEFAGALAHGDVEGIGQAHLGARQRGARRAYLGQHGAVVEHALDQRLDLAAAFLGAEEARLEHARVVHHQQVARLQQAHDVGKLAVDDLRAVQVQQAGSAAVGQRKLRDALWRQVKIEIGKRVHGRTCENGHHHRGSAPAWRRHVAGRGRGGQERDHLQAAPAAAGAYRGRHGRPAIAVHEFLRQPGQAAGRGHAGARARRTETRLLRRRDGPSRVQDRQRGRTAAHVVDARVSVGRRPVATDPAAGHRRRHEARGLDRHPARRPAFCHAAVRLRTGREIAALSAAAGGRTRAGRPFAPGVDAREIRRAAGAAAVPETRAACAAVQGRGGAEGDRQIVQAVPGRAARQDRGVGAGRRPGHRQRLPGGADGAYRNPGRAALPQDRRVDGAAGREGGVADGQPQKEGQAGRVRHDRIGRGAAGGGHACADPGGRDLRQPGPAHDVGHADPAHAGHDLLRRPGSVRDRRTAAGPHAHRHPHHRPEPPRRSDRTGARGGARRPAGVLGMPADRGIGSAAAADGHRHARAAGRSAARPERGAGARAPEIGREAGDHGRLYGQRDAGAGGHHRDRGGRGRAQCVADGDRARGAFRPVAAAPAARARGTGFGGQRLPAAVPKPAGRHRQAAPDDNARNHGRF
uniref:HTH gntR-type domain-containing protein n=1 Tax=Tanacetum cinerariifolium TaxID=118510 RepID=A0A699GF05_TANCI|nr:hypothetical protein [Tanacetum cinerariifolium]